MARGRVEGRADPPESFQIYTAGYVQFWNHDDEACDHITWAWWGRNVPILRGLRFRMNALVDKLNNVISSVSTQLSGIGVVYVDGFQNDLAKHRFCGPKADGTPESDKYLRRPIGSRTWFWHDDSPWAEGGEGPDDDSTTGATNL